MIDPAEPFARPLRPLWRPRAMSEPPQLDPHVPAAPCQRRYALLINPFYPKDAHASFGKHVLTPTLALTSFAATSPPHWRVEYWDENLLHGRPPYDRCLSWWASRYTLHLRSGRLRLPTGIGAEGSKVVLGGLHVLSCPEECRPHADALALGDGVQMWPRILADCEAGKLQKSYCGHLRE